MTRSRIDDGDRDEALLRARLADAEETLQAIRQGAIDALVIEDGGGNRIYTLHSAEEPYRVLVEQMQEGAVVLTAAGNITYANARFAALVGEPLETLIGTEIHRFVADTDREAFASLLKSGHGRQRGTLTIAGASLDVSLSVSTTAAAGGDHLNLIVTDLRELLEAQGSRERAERDNRTKDEFLAMLSHELRNPLGAISSATGVLELTQEAGTAAARAADVIKRQVAHIKHLIEDLLDVERVVSGKLRLQRQPLDLAQTVQRLMAVFMTDARFDWRLDIAGESLWADVDAVRIEQVLTNIVTNAVKYTPPGGRIAVALRAEGAHVVLSVEDSGLGISPRLLPYVFDMYMQADRTLDRAAGGLGIGLGLVQRLIALHGGTIDATSKGEGCGSKFTVRLTRIPAIVVDAAIAPAAHRREFDGYLAKPVDPNFSRAG